MIHLKKYEDFSKIDEGLDSRDIKLIKLLPKMLVSIVIDKLFGVYHLLNTKWNDLKKATTDSKHDSLFSQGGGVSTMASDLIKVDKKSLPDNKLKFGMFLRNWNVYLSSDKVKEYSRSNDRPIVYISKDELKKRR